MNDEGVSAVVSAVLIFTLFSTAFLFWTVDTLPEWIGEREHAHALATSSQMSRMGAELDAVRTGEVVSVNIDLAPSRIALLQTAPVTGTIEVQDGFRFTTAYAGAEAFMIGGAMVAQPAASLPSATGVATIRAFEAAYQGGGNNQAGQLQVTAFADLDGDGVLDPTEEAVQARIGKRAGNQAVVCGNTEAFLDVATGTGGSLAVIATHVLACNPENSATFSVNLMAEQYRFASLLGRLGDEYALSTASIGAGTGRVAAVWTDTEGATHAVGTGATAAPAVDVEGAHIQFSAAYREFPQRTLLYQGGGVINVEDLGAAFAQNPVFHISQAGGEGFMRWRVVDLSGGGAVSGTDAHTVRLTKVAVSEHVVRLDGGDVASFTLATAAPGAWQQLWADARVLAGVDAADMVVGGASGEATLTLANIPWTVHLSVIHADASVT